MINGIVSTRCRLLIALIIAVLVIIVIFQQSRIRYLQQIKSTSSAEKLPVHNQNLRTNTEALADASVPTRTRRDDKLLEKAREEHLDEVETNLEEIIAPLEQDMTSTMFKAEVKQGQSVVTGGYKTPDGKNQFTILKPKLIRDDAGREFISIESKVLDMGTDDTAATGLDSLATNAKNTLQHAETWEESDVSGTFETLSQSRQSDVLSNPSILAKPGQEFSISIGSDTTRSYVLKGIAQPTPDSSGVVIQARVEQKYSTTGN